MVRRYLRSALWEYPLCVLCSAALARTLFQGFYLPEDLSGSPLLTALLALALQAAFLLFGYSRRTVVLGIVCWIAALAALLLWARSAPAGIPLWLLLNAVPSAAVYLLSRSRVGGWVLLLLGILVCAAAAFLEYALSPLPLLIFLWAGICLLGCRAYRRSVLTGSAAKTSFPAAFLTSAVACALALSLAAGCYAAVIRPLNPPTRELKLLTRLVSLEVLERIGVSSQVHIFDEDRFSDQTGEEDRISPLEGEEPRQGPDETLPQSLPPQAGEENRPEEGNGPDGLEAQAISYLDKPILPILLPIVVVLAVVGAVQLKRLSRKLWRRRTEDLPPGEQAERLYTAMVAKFRRLKLPVPGPDTPYEYARRVDTALTRLLGREHGFDALTEAVVRARYGGLAPDLETLERCWRFWEQFYPRCRRGLGAFQYARLFFFL